jgi:hypothetical protein
MLAPSQLLPRQGRPTQAVSLIGGDLLAADDEESHCQERFVGCLFEVEIEPVLPHKEAVQTAQRLGPDSSWQESRLPRLHRLAPSAAAARLAGL